MRSTSKGKWMPGSLPSLRETHARGYEFYCDACERGFATQSSYDKHNDTELHFKRKYKFLPQNESVTGKKGLGFSFDPLVDNDVLYSLQRRRNLKTRNNALPDRNEETGDHVRCPTCFANFRKDMMGNHLLSFYHCQQSDIEGRLEEPEKSLILENIHSIVLLSPYQCKPCSFYFTHSLQLLEHFEKIHMDNQSKVSKTSNPTGWICSACTNRGYDADGMLKHLKDSPEHAKMEAAIQKSIPIVIKEVDLHACTFCEKTFILSREYHSHHCSNFAKDREKGVRRKKQRYNGSNNPDYEDVVEPKITKLNIRDPHVLSSNVCSVKQGLQPYQESPFTCEICRFVAKNNYNLNRHFKTHDEDRKRSFVCKLCKAAFYEKFQLNYHMKIHTGKLVKCNFPGCKYVGRSNSEVTVHAVLHTDTKQHKCPHCDYETKCRSHLTRHCKLMHQVVNNSGKKFKCKLCNYATNLPQGLKRHELNTHTIDNLFTCPYCPYSGKNMDNIRIHIRKRKFHKGAMLYTCQVCNPEEKAIFRSDKFVDFKQHVVQNHSANSHSTTDEGIFILAGLRKPADPNVNTFQNASSVKRSKGGANKREKSANSKTFAQSPSIIAKQPIISSKISEIEIEALTVRMEISEIKSLTVSTEISEIIAESPSTEVSEIEIETPIFSTEVEVVSSPDSTEISEIKMDLTKENKLLQCVLDGNGSNPEFMTSAIKNECEEFEVSTSLADDIGKQDLNLIDIEISPSKEGETDVQFCEFLGDILRDDSMVLSSLGSVIDE